MNYRRSSSAPNSSFDRKWAVERFQEVKYYPRSSRPKRCSWRQIRQIKTIRRPSSLITGFIALFLIVATRYRTKPSPVPLNTSNNDKISTTKAAEAELNPVEDYCHHFDGVLYISRGDRNGAAGTVFFFFVLNQILFAEKHNLQPFIHLNMHSRHIYDAKVHGQAGDGNGVASSSSSFSTTVYKITQELEPTWDYYIDPLAMNKSYPYPGKPKTTDNYLMESTLTVLGSGVWNSYFESTVPLKIGPAQTTYNVNINRPCPNKPILHLNTDEQIVQGLHLNCPYCLRSWKYGGVPPSLKLPTSYQEWWKPMRKTGHEMVEKYYHAKPELQQLADQANPLSPSSSKIEQKCLAMHIRHSDKANKREKIPLAAFLLYCQAYVDAGGQIIYLATDSSRAIQKIQDTWPPDLVARIRYQKSAFRSPDETAVFDAILTDNGEDGHHRTNQEVLVDILAMAKCDYFLHGLSAVSEATIYWNGKLHERSVNLEFYQFYKRKGGAREDRDDDAPMSLEKFRIMLQNTGVS